MGTELHADDDVARCQLILDTLSGPRVIYRDGQARVDLSAFDRPFAPAVQRSGTALATRRATTG